MSYEKVRMSANVKIGTKQSMKLVQSDNAAEVFVASDADPRITSKIVELCKKKGIAVTYVDSMKKLGLACGIDVGAAIATIEHATIESE